MKGFDEKRRAQFVRRLITLLLAHDLDEKDLSRRAGLSDGAVGDMTSGKSTNPNIDTFIRLAAALDTSVGYLIGEVQGDRGQREEMAAATRLVEAVDEATRLRLERKAARRHVRALRRLIDKK